MVVSHMKKLFLTEFDTSDKKADYPVHLTINGAGSDKKADYGDDAGNQKPTYYVLFTHQMQLFGL